MQRLSGSMEYIIGNIHHIIDRTQSDSRQTLLQPIGTFCHFHIPHRHSAVPDTCFMVRYIDIDTALFSIDSEIVYRRPVQSGIFTPLCQISGQITGNAIMRSCIDTIRGNIHFEDIIALYIIIVFGQCTGLYLSRQHDNAIVRSSYTYFVFGTNHTERFHSANLRFFNRKTFFTTIQNSTQRSHYHVLSRRDIRSSTHDLNRLGFPQIHGSNVQMI